MRANGGAANRYRDAPPFCFTPPSHPRCPVPREFSFLSSLLTTAIKGDGAAGLFHNSTVFCPPSLFFTSLLLLFLAIGLGLIADPLSRPAVTLFPSYPVRPQPFHPPFFPFGQEKKSSPSWRFLPNLHHQTETHFSRYPVNTAKMVK